MDKKEHLTDAEYDVMIEEGFNFDDIIGQHVKFDIVGIKEADARWHVNANANFSLSKDGVTWAGKDIPVTTADDDYDSALATAMLAMANAINSPRLMASLRRELDAYVALPEAKDLQ